MSIPDTYDDYLAHYGVKGMKWGRRKNTDGSKMTRDQNRKAATAEREAETGRRLGAAKGSLRVRKAKVATGVVAKTAGTMVAATVGRNVATNVIKNQNVAMAGVVATRVYNVNLGIAAVKDLNSIVKYKE